MHPIKMLLLLLATVSALFASTAIAANKQKPITINFQATVDDKAFAYGQSYNGIGISKSHITPTDFRFFISQVELIDKKGNAVPLTLKQDGVWQYQNVALLDFENGTGPCLNGNSGINKKISGTVPKNQYQGLRLTLGIPPELNHGDATIAPPPLNVTSLFWTWRAGYKFLRLDMATTGFPELPKLKVKGADGKPIDEDKDKDEAAAHQKA
jgi:hypothetical protein